MGAVSLHTVAGVWVDPMDVTVHLRGRKRKWYVRYHCAECRQLTERARAGAATLPALDPDNFWGLQDDAVPSATPSPRQPVLQGRLPVSAAT
jgi:hypothetical protein